MRRFGLLAVVCCLIADVVLVLLAIGPLRSAAAPQVRAPSPAANVPATPAAPPAVSLPGGGTAAAGTAPIGPTTPATPVPPTVLVAALDARTAWRATSGTCRAGGASLQVTRDGGRTWASVPPPTRALVRVQPQNATGKGFVVGAGADCAPAQYATLDSGATWAPAQVDGNWALRPERGSAVLAPGSPQARPCGDATVVDLARTAPTQAQALCANGKVKVTDNGGASWSDGGDAPRALALASRGSGVALATVVASVVPSCRGIQLARVARGSGATQVACVAAAAPQGPGLVALSLVDDAGWLVVDGQTWRSGADLRTWTRA